MQSQAQLVHKIEPNKRYLITINSLNRTTVDARSKNYKTLDKDQKSSVGVVLNTSSLQSQLLATKIINVELNSQLFDIAHRSYKNNESINRILFPSSDRNRYRCQQKVNKEIFRKAKGGVKVIAKYKFPLPDQKTPMKKYIKIQKIKLPRNQDTCKESPTRLKPNISVEITDQMKKTIDEYSKYVERKSQRETVSSIAKSKIHRRNHSSILDPHKNIVDGLILEREKTKKPDTEDFQIRRPLARKDYFVFGLSDRTNPQNKVEYFRDFLWKINYSNSLHICTPQQVVNPYRAYIGPGNNFHLVKSVLKRRFWWTIVEKNQAAEPINFLWTQLKQNNFYLQQQKSEFVIQNGQKCDQVQRTLHKSDSQTTKQPTPSSSQQDFHKKLFSKSDLDNWGKHVLRNEKTEQKISQHTYIKRMGLLQNKEIRNIENSAKLKVHNHLESNFFIGNKKALFYNVRRYLNLKGVDPFTMLPMTFHLSKGIEDPQFKIFKKYYEQIQTTKNSTGLRNIWIVKPGENTNRGNGITVAYSIDDIVIRLKGRQKNSDGKLRTFIIQKYIQRPLLYYKRKFDIRHYMLITCINGIFKAYWYEEGYIRTSSSEFTTKYSKDPFVHLTNDAIQKNGANYGKFEKGNKLSYQDFQKYLDLTSKTKKINFFDQILPEMKQMAAQSVKATYAILDQNRREHNFQLLGLDFMIDEDLKPWLIEVNTNPCLQLSCSLLEKIIPQLIDNVFKICIDPLFPPPECWQTGKKLYFGDNPLAQNKFELIFDQFDDGQEIQTLYSGINFVDEKMGKIEEDDEVFEDDGDEDWENKK